MSIEVEVNIPTEIKAKLQHDGNNTKLWCKQNKMETNYGTTTCTIVRIQHTIKRIQPFNIFIDSNTFQKCYGIYIDENFHWTDGIDLL